MNTPSTVVDRSYQLLEQLGEGGMGTVFRARHLLNNQVVALKLVSPRCRAEDGAASVSRFQGDIELRLALAREFQTLASLHHPNVIRVQSYGFDDQQGSYFTMELLEHARTILRTEEGTPDADKVLLVAQLLRALSYIHRRGVIHRDIKPGNVLVVRGEVKLLDFGIAAGDANGGELAGTFQYMAPELLYGSTPSVASDLYAVGLILHQLLTGHMPSHDADLPRSVPPQGGQPVTSLTMALGRLEQESGDTRPELPINISGPLGGVVRKLLRPHPADRYQDADSVLRDLSQALLLDIPVETTETRESFLRATVLVGRDAELTLLRERLSDCQQGTGCAVLLGGESGVGKSRLLAELRTLALVYGFWTAEGQSVTEGGTYYQEWLPLLRALCLRVDVSDEAAAVLKPMLPDIATLLGRPIADPPVIPAEGVPARLTATLHTLLGRLQRPLLVILEDIHWGRSESLSLLRELSQSIARYPVMLVVTYRSDETPELPEQLPSVQLLLLRRLGHAQIAQLSESMLGAVGKRPELVEYLERQTEGNVFFLIEIVRALAEDVGGLQLIGQGTLPESLLTTGIERIVERRVEHVAPEYRPVLAFAATLGRTLDVRALMQAFPTLALRSMLLQCANAAVLESQGAEWRFAHDKLRETILRRLGREEARALNLQVAQALEAAYVGVERTAKSSLLAHHYGEAGAHEAALRYLIMAGDSAAALFLLGEARRHYAAARATFERLPETAELRRLLVDVLLRQVQTGLLNDATEVQLQRMAQARAILEGLSASAAARREDRLRSARVDYYVGRAYHYSGQPAQAIKYYRRVLPVAQEFDDQELLTTPSYVIGIALCLQGQFARARSLLERARAPMERLQGPSVDTIRCISYYGIALSGSGQRQRALIELRRAQQLAEAGNQPVHLVIYNVIAGVSSYVSGDWPATIEVFERAYAISQKTSEQLFAYIALDFMGWCKTHLGQHREAMELRARAVTMREAVGGGIVRDWFDAAEAEILLNLGRTEEALARARAAADASRSADLPFSRAVAERLTGVAMARLGASPLDYEPHLAASLLICAQHDQVINSAHTERTWAVLCQQRGDHAKAQEHAQRALAALRAEGYEHALDETERLLREGGLQLPAPPALPAR
jgi:predicted ATPase